MEEFSPHEPSEGGVRRRSQIAHVSKFDTIVVVERWPNGRIGITERDAERSSPRRSISLSDEEARIIRDALDRVLATDPNRPVDFAASEEGSGSRLEGSPPVPTHMSAAPSAEGPSRTGRGLA